jgi:hypothetical protein
MNTEEKDKIDEQTNLSPRYWLFQDLVLAVGLSLAVVVLVMLGTLGIAKRAHAEWIVPIGFSIIIFPMGMRALVAGQQRAPIRFVAWTIATVLAIIVPTFSHAWLWI